MPLIECRAGREVSETVAGTTYTFRRDPYGRYTAIVSNGRHARCFLGLTAMYREVPEEPDPDTDAAPPKPKAKAKPAVKPETAADKPKA